MKQVRNYVESLDDAKKYNLMPKYSEYAIEYINKKYNKDNNNFAIAEIGSGTGKLTADLLKIGCEVYAVEPDDNMRKVCEENCSEYKKFHSIKGVDDETGLLGKSVDLVVVAQSFHSFNQEGFQKECNRILKNENNIAIIYNRFDFSKGILKELLFQTMNIFTDLQLRYDPNNIYDEFYKECLENTLSVKSFFNNSFSNELFENRVRLNKQQFFDLFNSFQIYPITHKGNSIKNIIKSNNEKYEEYQNALENIFNKYSQSDMIEFVATTQVMSNDKKRLLYDF